MFLSGDLLYFVNRAGNAGKSLQWSKSAPCALYKFGDHKTAFPEEVPAQVGRVTGFSQSRINWGGEVPWESHPASPGGFPEG